MICLGNFTNQARITKELFLLIFCSLFSWFLQDYGSTSIWNCGYYAQLLGGMCLHSLLLVSLYIILYLKSSGTFKLMTCEFILKILS